MASSSGNTNTTPQPISPAPFDMHKLFKPPQSPNPNPPIPSPTSAPSPSLPFPFHHHYPPPPYTFPPVPHNPNSGAHIMALLGTPAVVPNPPPSPHLESAMSMPMPLPSALHSASSGESLGPARVASGKLPMGRHLSTGDQAVYDVDVRLTGETQPTQLEVTPITKYVSDPGLVLGRQIAVNRTYICYGLKLGAVRVLNINTALRSLLRGHNQRVSDMAFFAEDVHLLASASIDGRVFVWSINEGPDEHGKPQITGKIVIAIQLVSNEESVHPRVCWHCHKQEVLVVAFGNLVLKIDTTKVGRGETFTADEPLKCSIDELIDGIQLIGRHDGEVTDLSMSQWMTTRLASASNDGTLSSTTVVKTRIKLRKPEEIRENEDSRYKNFTWFVNFVYVHKVKIWDERKALPLVTLRPHDAQPVNSVAFLTAPNHPDHIVLITAGPLNRELKIWASSSEEGWLLPSDSESWHCTQTLVLKSSTEPQIEEAFFNQVVVLPHASLILLANAKKNAIYAVHIDYGSNPSSTRLDYITEFTVTMPILSLTGTTDCLPDGEQVAQVYCVQTQAIQQYALELSKCTPPPFDNGGIEKETSFSRGYATISTNNFSTPEYSSGINVSEMERGLSSSLHVSSTISESTNAIRYPTLSSNPEVSSALDDNSNLEWNVFAPHSGVDSDISCTLSQPVSSNPDVPEKSSGFRNLQKGYEQTAGPFRKRDGAVETGPTEESSRISAREEAKSHQDTSNVHNTTHLVTPSEILSGAVSSYEHASAVREQAGETRVTDTPISNALENVEVDVKVVGENGPRLDELVSHRDSSSATAKNKERISSSDASETNLEMIKEYSAIKADVTNAVESQMVKDGVHESAERPILVNDQEVQEIMKDVSESTVESAKVTSVGQSPATKSKKKKAKQSQVPGPSPSSANLDNSIDSINEQESSIDIPLNNAASSQMLVIMESVNQLITMQKEMQKQISTAVSVPVSKEGKRIEASLGRSMECTIKANVDALWARFQEENAKREKQEKDRAQQISNQFTNCMNKDFPIMFEKALKKEFSSVGPAVARILTPVIEKTISSAVVDSVQRVIGDKVIGQLEKSVNSKLDATVARQIQVQFQTSGKQALQDTLRSTLEASIVPAFEQSCKSMFEQVDVAFQKGISEHAASAQKQLESTHTPLVLTLRDAINSASSFTQSLTNELAEGQRKLLALAVSGNQNPLSSMQQSNDPLGGLPMVEAPVDPTKDLSRLISERKFDEAFTIALQRSDVSLVSWLCSQVDLQALCSMTPLPLSQGVLLALLQQLACDISNDTSRKLGWMTEVAVVVNPVDPTIALHVRPIFDQIYQILIHQRSQPTTSSLEASSIRVMMHIINSVLMSCK